MNHAASPLATQRLSQAITAGGAQLQWRYVKDVAAKYTVGVGGVAVLVALLLIFVYLLMQVVPLFKPADIKPRSEFAVPGDGGRTLYVTAEEQSEVGLRVSESGELTFFQLADGKVRKQDRLPIGSSTVTQIVEVAPDQGYLAAGLSDGSVLLFKHAYQVSYPDNQRYIDPGIEYPYGQTPRPFMTETPRTLVARDAGGQLLFAATDSRNQVHIKTLEVQTSLMGDSSIQPLSDLTYVPALTPDLLLVDPLASWLYVIDARSGQIALHQLRGAEAPLLLNQESVGGKVLAAHFMAGGISVLTANDHGQVTQWFPAHKEDGAWYLARVRSFDAGQGTPISALGVEQRRRSFAVGDDSGRVSLYYTTSQRKLVEKQLLSGPVDFLTFEPRAHTLVALGADRIIRTFDVENSYPEVSWSSLWEHVWYESYDEPKLLWQSSSAVGDFEPKFSLAPLTIGTIKGAFYAMIFAVPLAILGAIFTANFMSPALRQVVKPTVEIMQALPTVILGFLAGLWLAPFVESNLAGIFLSLLLLPLSIPLFGYLWLRMPAAVRYRVPEGWEAVLLAPVIAVVVWLCFMLAQPLEVLLFGGNMQAWMDRELHIGYEQRNCLVVGIAMGVAVIPAIFSIAEDAIFSVPKQLSLGSMALGATPWQTLVGVVLPTASPGIFSAIMIGLGRAVGETMIVLMATGNTPVTDFSMFSGMRTLSANVAVEMPESEVGSTHFRMLFMAGLVLFVLTFFFNTLAEVVRGRLRQKYSNL